MAAPIKWAVLIDQFEGAGFDGDGDDFAAVIKWLKINGHDTETIDCGDGQRFELKEIYDERPGKPFDAKEALERSRRDDEVSEMVRRELEAIDEASGRKAKSKTPEKGHRHDVKVGQDGIERDPKGGFKSFGHFLTDVAISGQDEGHKSDSLQYWSKATLSTYGSEGVGTDGGFAVPPEFREQIMVHVQSEDGILGRTDQYPLAGNSIAFPDDETTPWGSSGIQSYWEGEAGALTQSKPSLKLKELKLRKITALVPVTEELLEDAGAMGAYVTRKAGQVIAFQVDNALVRGTGAGQPLGILNASGTISQAAEGSQVSTTFIGLNVLKMWSRLYGPYRRDAIWLINQDVEPDMLRMSLAGRDNIGSDVTGWGGLVYMPPGGVSGSPYGTLLGRPVIPHQACSTLGTVGDVILGSWNQYALALKSGGIEAQSSIHLFFDQDAVCFKFRMRVDGQPWLSAAISALNGSNTMSSFVTLAAR